MALYELTEFSSYVQEDVNTATALLLRTLVSGLIDEVATFDGTYPVTVKAIALEAAARPYRNPQGLQSITEAVDDYNGTRRWDAGTLGLYLTDSERRDIRTAGGLTTGRALWTQPTTRSEFDNGTQYVPTGPEPSGYPFPWYADDVIL